jgi:nucleotide-binding universal stress UspA family protein
MHRLRFFQNARESAKGQGLALSDPERAYGNVVHEILRAVKERQVDLLVMGTCGLGAVRGMLLLGGFNLS